MAKIRLHVNGKKYTVDVDPDTPLLWVLRESLGLTGTKYSCGDGLCGSCTVLMDGEAVRSCVFTAADAAGKKIVTIDRIFCVIDCGQVVHPQGVRQQMEGAVVFALSAVLRGAITVDKGGIVQGNFDDYEPLRINETPAVDVHMVESHLPPGGVGEPGVPPVAPALCNAIFAACGIRVRRLPVTSNSLKAVDE